MSETTYCFSSNFFAPDEDLLLNIPILNFRDFHQNGTNIYFDIGS